GDPLDPFAIIPTLPDNIKVRNDGAIDWRQDTGVIRYRGDVIVETDTGIQLFADLAEVDTRNKIVRVIGNVSVYQGAVLHRGDRAEFHYDTNHLETRDLRTSIDPVLLEADSFRAVERDGRRYFVGENAGLTTHDEEDPSYWLRADRTTVIPGDRMIFRNLKLYVGDRQVFWLPYLSQNFDERLGYLITPGARSHLGIYALNRYGVLLGGEVDPETGEKTDAWLLAQLRADLMSKRGVGTGVDFFDTRLDDNPNLGWLKLYYLSDLDPSQQRGGEIRARVNEDRFRAQLRHRLGLDWFDAGETHLDTDFTLLSDRYYLQDFEPATFRTEPTPDNKLALTHQRGRDLYTASARIRGNDFYQSDTRLPELTLDQMRHPLGEGPLLHEGQVTWGLYDEYLPDFKARNLRAEAAMLPMGDPRRAAINALLADRGFSRFHLYQELSLPFKVDPGITIVPRAGFGYTNYSSVEGPSPSTDRSLSFIGADASMKFSRSYDDIHSEEWGLDGLLHIVQPYSTLSHVVTNELDSSFPRIDRLTATTRPRPLGVGRFTAVDDLESWSILRLGVRNRLLTHRNAGTHEWLTMNTYVDWFLEDPEFDREFSNLYNDIAWSPVPWINLILETQFPVADSGPDFIEIASGLRWMPDDDVEVTLKHRYLDNHPILRNSTRVELQAYARLNDEWGAGFTHLWEFDDGTLELQQYSLHRNFDSWAVSLGLFHRDNPIQDEFGFVLGFTLKDFPSASLPLRIDAE
ncbi:MAG: LPS-assembly protein LptD, partial [Akkermansiaceae bacterium]|nr:LPS-assembly protein LptD [Akkermansiaceae bacterium]